MAPKQSASSRGAIVVVGAPKGGVGKSSLAWELAQGFARAGTRTCLIDGDETATVATMYDNRMDGPLKNETSPAVVIAPEHIERTVVDLARGNELVVVDLGARDWDRYATLPLVADLWIMPTDFSSTNMMPAARLFNEQLWPKRGRHHSGGPVPVRLAWCRTPTHTGNASALERSLAWWQEAITATTGLESEQGQRFNPATGFDAFDSQLRSRPTPWEEAQNRGATLAELPPSVGSRAAAEVQHLLVEVQAVLAGSPGAK